LGGSKAAVIGPENALGAVLVFPGGPLTAPPAPSMVAAREDQGLESSAKQYCYGRQRAFRQ
jgi:hypothetical protein